MGCGGAVDTDLLGNPGTDAGKDTSSGADTSTGDDGGIPIADASVSDAISVFDAEPIFDATPVLDAAPADPGTLCFTQYQPPISTYCKNGTDMCCIKQNASSCVAQGGVCAGGTRMSCDDSTSCDNGKICCGSLMSFNGNSYYSEITCATTCAVNTSVPGLRRFCNPKAPVDECVSIGLKCGPSNVLNGYYVCN